MPWLPPSASRRTVLTRTRPSFLNRFSENISLTRLFKADFTDGDFHITLLARARAYCAEIPEGLLPEGSESSDTRQLVSAYFALFNSGSIGPLSNDSVQN